MEGRTLGRGLAFHNPSIIYQGHKGRGSALDSIQCLPIYTNTFTYIRIYQKYIQGGEGGRRGKSNPFPPIEALTNKKLYGNYNIYFTIFMNDHV